MKCLKKKTPFVSFTCSGQDRKCEDHVTIARRRRCSSPRVHCLPVNYAKRERYYSTDTRPEGNDRRAVLNNLRGRRQKKKIVIKKTKRNKKNGERRTGAGQVRVLGNGYGTTQQYNAAAAADATARCVVNACWNVRATLRHRFAGRVVNDCGRTGPAARRTSAVAAAVEDGAAGPVWPRADGQRGQSAAGAFRTIFCFFFSLFSLFFFFSPPAIVVLHVLYGV